MPISCWRAAEFRLTGDWGEIVGIAGVAGNGQSELLEALAGIRPVKLGHIRWRARDITDAEARSPRGIRRLGLSLVPEDRQRMGLIIPFTARESAIRRRRPRGLPRPGARGRRGRRPDGGRGAPSRPGMVRLVGDHRRPRGGLPAPPGIRGGRRGARDGAPGLGARRPRRDAGRRLVRRKGGHAHGP